MWLINNEWSENMSNLKNYAKTIVNYSCDVQPGENVYILAEGNEAKPLVIELINEVYSKGANPFFEIVDTDVQKAMLKNCNTAQMEVFGESQLQKVKTMQVLIVISALDNPYKYSDIPLEKMALYNKNFMQKCFFGYGVMNTKWIYIKYPTNAMAQLFTKSKEVFEDYYFKVCNLDYGKMSPHMDKLVELFNKTDKVRIVAKDTDLSFSIKGIPAQKSDGKNGLPDGEVFTAPVKNSANGYISFNCPVYFRGTLFENIKLEFKDGKIVKAEANETEKFNKIIDMDAGGRYLGEFAMAFNNHITSPMKDILFDEKIGGSIHLALGNSYMTTDNGNHSVIHMDIVQLQTPEYGGGEVYFDDVLVRKDGKFLLDEISELNKKL